MEQDDFFKTVGTSKVLTAEESFDIALHIKELTPHNKLSFKCEPRVGTWDEHMFTDACYCTPVNTNHIRQQFMLHVRQGRIFISSIYLLNASGHELSVNFTRDGNVRQLENRLHQGQQLYEAVFHPPVPARSGNHVINFTSTRGLFSATQIQGKNTSQHKDVSISTLSHTWYFIVGFKLKKV